MSVEHRHKAGCQFFQFAVSRWCISHARELIEADPDAARLVEDIEIEPFRQFLPLDKPRPGFIKLIEVRVDAAYAATTDLARPIMLAPIISDSGERFGGVVIDGWHRVYRALTDGVVELPGYVLTEATSRAVLMHWR